jgi:hypothetical protein
VRSAIQELSIAWTVPLISKQDAYKRPGVCGVTSIRRVPAQRRCLCSSATSLDALDFTERRCVSCLEGIDRNVLMPTGLTWHFVDFDLAIDIADFSFCSDTRCDSPHAVISTCMAPDENWQK